MTAGHFAVATGVKGLAPRIPLWALMVATYLLDFAFIVLVGFGRESFSPLDATHPAYGQVTIHAPYSHSLIGAALLASMAALTARRSWGPNARLVMAGVVLSHWLLDLVVHRPDLAVLPANAGSLPLLGLGLWRAPTASALVEVGLCLGGTWLYLRQARVAAHRNLSTAPLVTGTLLLTLLGCDFFTAPLLVEIVLMLLLIVLCGWLDSKLWARARPRPAHA